MGLFTKTGEPKLKKKERQEAQRDLQEKERSLKEEIKNMEKVSQLNEQLEYEYTKPKKSSTIGVLRYNSMYEDGLCEVCTNVYSFTVAFSNISYQIAGDEEQARIFTKYCELLNYFPHTVNVQITIRNYYRDNEVFFDSISMPLGGNYDTYAKEINMMLADKATHGDNSLIAANYITVTFASGNLKEALALSASIKAELRKYFKAIKCGYQFLSGVERVKLLASYFQGNYFNFNYNHLLASGLTTKSYIAPEAFDFKPDNYYSFSGGGQKKYGQTIILKDLPPNMADNLIATLTDTKCELTFNIFIRPIRQEASLLLVKNQRAKMDMQATQIQEKNLQRVGNMGMLPFELRSSMEDADNLLHDMEKRNQRLFRVTLLLYTTADSEEKLSENIFRLKASARKCNCDFVDLPEQQESALNSILPIGACYIDVERNLTTVNTAIFMPFTTQEVQHEGGIYYGQNAITNNLLIVNRDNIKNGNCVILGVSGGGKSFKGKEEISQVLVKYPNDRVIVIDPENEFSTLGNLMGGEIIEISAGSSTHLNPFDMNISYGDGENPLLRKGEFILSVCETVLGALSPMEKSLLDKTMRIVYEPFFKEQMKAEHTPTLKELCAVLTKMEEPEAKRLAASLDLYTNGSLSAFAHQTNVNMQNRFTVFNTFKLGGQLKTLGMMIVIDYLWNKVYEHWQKGIRTWIYVDEMQVFFDSATSSRYFSDIWARFRKRNAYATGLTQNVQRIIANEDVKHVLSNSEFIIMLDQAKGDREALTEILEISEDQQDYITNSDVGQGLLRVGSAIIPFVDEFPKDTELYRVMSTKPSDMIFEN